MIRFSDGCSALGVVTCIVALMIGGARKVTGDPIYGLTGVQPFFPPGTAITDGIKARYKFRVSENKSPTIKIIFGYFRVHGSSKNTVMIESKVYADSLRYRDYTKTTWPMLGSWKAAEATYRIAVEDRDVPGITGAKTSDPAVFPRQTYVVDGIKNFWKTDMISQENLNGKVVQVEIARGTMVKDRGGWKHGGELLDDLPYREWTSTVSWDNRSFTLTYALPEDSSQYFTDEMLSFNTEFLHTPGTFTLDFWDYQVFRESTSVWQNVSLQRVSHNDDPGLHFGVRTAQVNGAHAVEISNTKEGGYLPVDSIIDLNSGSVVRGGTPERKQTNLRTVNAALDRIRVKWDQPWIDAANSIFINPTYDAEVWRNFFSSYFAKLTATSELWNYLQYPAFGWFDADTHRKLQTALNEVARARIVNLLSDHALTLDRFFRNDAAALEDVTAWFDFLRRYEREHTRDLSDQSDKDWFADIAARYPQLFTQLTTQQRQLYPRTAWFVDQMNEALHSVYAPKGK